MIVDQRFRPAGMANERGGQAVVRFRELWAYRQCLAAMGDGLLQLSLPSQGDAQIIVRPANLGLRRNALAVINCFFQFAFLEQNDGEIVVGFGVVRIEPQCLRVMHQSFLY